MAEAKLTPRQQAQLDVLGTLPPRFEQIHRMVEELASLRADEALARRLCRLLDESKAATATMGLPALADTFGMMSMLARRTSGLQMKIRGLREGLASLKINFEGAWRSASTPEDPSASAPPDDRSGDRK
ncbi:MAG: hypothetical protein ACRENB_02940 [Gemmatimonadales bacterium]